MKTRFLFSLFLLIMGFFLYSQNGHVIDMYGARTPVVAPDIVNFEEVFQYDQGIKPLSAGVYLLNEGFDDISAITATGNGWKIINNSHQKGETSWFQGSYSPFIAYDGPDNAYIAANFLNASLNVNGTISTWLITPRIAMQNDDVLSFWTRTTQGSTYPDRLEVRASVNGSSTFVGNSASETGDFNILLLSVNPTLSGGGQYPDKWTEYKVVITGLSDVQYGRIAFRYYVTDTDKNGNYIGLDRVQFVSMSAPVPLSNWTILLGVCLMGGFFLFFSTRKIV